MKSLKKIVCILLLFSMIFQIGCGTKKERYKTKNGEENIVNGAIKHNEEGTVWQISNENLNPFLKETERIEVFHDNLLFIGEDSSKLVSIKTGEVLGEVNYDEFKSPAIDVRGEKLVINGLKEKKVLILDGKLKVEQEYSWTGKYKNVFVTNDTTKAICTSEKPKVILLDFTTGEETDFAVGLDATEENDGIPCMSFVNQDLSFETSVFDLENIAVKEIPFFDELSHIENRGNYWLAKDVQITHKYYYSDSEEIYFFPSENEESEYSLITGPATIYEELYGDEKNEYRLYDKQGTLASEYISEDGELIDKPIWSEVCGGYFFVEVGSESLPEQGALLFWEVGDAKKDVGLAMQLQYSFGGNVYENGLQTCYDRALELGEKYGVDMKVGEQCATSHFESYTMQQETDALEIHRAFRMFETVMSNYPEGFMKQLTYGTKKTIEISLVGKIGDGGKSEYGSGGFASSRPDGKNVIYIDISRNETEEMFYHEIMHIIDYKFMGIGKLDGIAWYKLNPQGYQYLEKYKKVDEGKLAVYKDWFVEDYSHVNWIEDRATVMEQAMAGNTEVFKGKPHLIAKLEFLCKNMRENFDTTGWPEQLPCEKTLAACK